MLVVLSPTSSKLSTNFFPVVMQIWRRGRSSAVAPSPSPKAVASGSFADDDITDVTNCALRKASVKKVDDKKRDEMEENERRYLEHHWRESLILPVMPRYDLCSVQVPKEGFIDLLSEGTLVLCNRLLRRWEKVQTSDFEGSTFRICSYNVLCQKIVSRTPFLYQHLLSGNGKEYALCWEYRSALLARELQMIDADVFCLQEVEHDHFEQFFLPTLHASGYRGIYKKRTGPMVDGCAIFYRTKLELVNCIDIEYYFGIDSPLNKNNIGQLARFRMKDSGKEFCVANTHLVFHKRLGDVKLAQTAFLLATLQKACDYDGFPYVMCGDFNMQPYSPMYNFLANGWLSFANLRRSEISGQLEEVDGSGTAVRLATEDGVRDSLTPNVVPPEANIDRDCRFQGTKKLLARECIINSWKHHMKFASVYSHFTVDQLPEISSFQSAKASNPDFIFYSVKDKVLKRPKNAGDRGILGITEGALHLTRRLSLPCESVLRGTLGPWPNAATPSDHIPLIAEFVLS